MLKKSLEFDHLNLNENEKKLIKLACGDKAEWVGLAPLDKGLSGSSVWLAKWRGSNFHSNYHVFKIGKSEKLIREKEAMRKIAAVIHRLFPNYEFYILKNEGLALLQQQFMGDTPGTDYSLREYILNCNTPEQVKNILNKLYLNCMSDWHNLENQRLQEKKLGEALNWWTERINLSSVSEQIGKSELDMSLKRKFRLTVESIEEMISNLFEFKDNLSIGPIHGDLHSQNVLVADGDRIQLIDFGWTGFKWRAIDFLMMECSLKFVVSPPHASLDDLLNIDIILDKYWDKDNVNYSSLSKCMHGRDIRKIIAGINTIRNCAIKLKAINSYKQYRMGLALLTAGLASMPSLLNRVFLFHSLAYHIKQLEK
jgi:hypothetical protein